jgi:hypothetical protein
VNQFTASAPVAGFTGESVGVVFKDGAGRVDDSTKEGRAAIEYFRRRGYTLTPEGADEEPEDGPQKPGGKNPPAPFDPSENDAPDVIAYLNATTDEDEITRVLEAERAGKARKTVLARGEQQEAQK